MEREAAVESRSCTHPVDVLEDDRIVRECEVTDMKTHAFIALGFLATFARRQWLRMPSRFWMLRVSKEGWLSCIGCDRPTLLAELRASESYLVHGLDRDPEKVAAARDYLREQGLYGPVTVSRWDGSQLPFVDSLVNLLVIRDDGMRDSR